MSYDRGRFVNENQYVPDFHGPLLNHARPAAVFVMDVDVEVVDGEPHYTVYFSSSVTGYSSYLKADLGKSLHLFRSFIQFNRSTNARYTVLDHLTRNLAHYIPQEDN